MPAILIIPSSSHSSCSHCPHCDSIRNARTESLEVRLRKQPKSSNEIYLIPVGFAAIVMIFVIYVIVKNG